MAQFSRCAVILPTPPPIWSTPTIESQSPKPEHHPTFIHDGHPYVGNNRHRRTVVRTFFIVIGFLLLAGIFTGIMCLLHYTFNWVWILALISMIFLFMGLLFCCVKI